MKFMKNNKVLIPKTFQMEYRTARFSSGISSAKILEIHPKLTPAVANVLIVQIERHVLVLLPVHLPPNRFALRTTVLQHRISGPFRIRARARAPRGLLLVPGGALRRTRQRRGLPPDRRRVAAHEVGDMVLLWAESWRAKAAGRNSGDVRALGVPEQLDALVGGPGEAPG